MKTNNLTAIAIAWLKRQDRTEEEICAYLSALDDAGIPNDKIDEIEKEFDKLWTPAAPDMDFKD